MAIFLKMFLLLGVAAVMIPSASGLKCVNCGPYTDGPKDCKDYTPGDFNFQKPCPAEYGANGIKFLCLRRKGPLSEDRKCAADYNGTVATKYCEPSGGNNAFCYCNKDLCNTDDLCNCGDSESSTDPSKKGTSPNTDGGGSGQQRALKGGSFGILGMVFLGGVGFIRGQLLWG